MDYDQDFATDGGGERVVNIKPGPVSFKSRLHSELRDRDKEIKSKFMNELDLKKQKAERLRSYSKNVKEMYMPKLSTRASQEL